MVVWLASVATPACISPFLGIIARDVTGISTQRKRGKYKAIISLLVFCENDPVFSEAGNLVVVEISQGVTSGLVVRSGDVWLIIHN